MTEAIFFVVERRASGGEEAAIYRDVLPKWLKGPKIVYALRLDKLPDGERWAKLPLAQVYAQYCWLRDHGKLPPANLTPPPRKSDGATRLLGDRWKPPARAWPDRPADPFPLPGSIALKPDAGAFINTEIGGSTATAASDPRPPSGMVSQPEEDDGRGIFLGIAKR